MRGSTIALVAGFAVVGYLVYCGARGEGPLAGLLGASSSSRPSSPQAPYFSTSSGDARRPSNTQIYSAGMTLLRSTTGETKP